MEFSLSLDYQLLLSDCNELFQRSATYLNGILDQFTTSVFNKYESAFSKIWATWTTDPELAKPRTWVTPIAEPLPIQTKGCGGVVSGLPANFWDPIEEGPKWDHTLTVASEGFIAIIIGTIIIIGVIISDLLEKADEKLKEEDPKAWLLRDAQNPRWKALVRKKMDEYLAFKKMIDDLNKGVYIPPRRRGPLFWLLGQEGWPWPGTWQVPGRNWPWRWGPGQAPSPWPPFGGPWEGPTNISPHPEDWDFWESGQAPPPGAPPWWGPSQPLPPGAGPWWKVPRPTPPGSGKL